MLPSINMPDEVEHAFRGISFPSIINCVDKVDDIAVSQVAHDHLTNWKLSLACLLQYQLAIILISHIACHHYVYQINIIKKSHYSLPWCQTVFIIPPILFLLTFFPNLLCSLPFLHFFFMQLSFVFIDFPFNFVLYSLFYFAS